MNGPSRRAMLGGLAAIPAIAMAGAAVATPAQPDRAKWDRRLKRYRILKALSDADYTFGVWKKSDRETTFERWRVGSEFGSWERARADAAGTLKCSAIFDQECANDEHHYRDFVVPSDKAAILLALTPAPDLEAALYKIDLITKESLDTVAGMPRDCMEIVHEDMRRLRAQ